MVLHHAIRIVSYLVGVVKRIQRGIYLLQTKQPCVCERGGGIYISYGELIMLKLGIALFENNVEQDKLLISQLIKIYIVFFSACKDMLITRILKFNLVKLMVGV